MMAQDSVDRVALTEVEAASEEELALQEPGRDLRPDTIVPAPDISAAEVEAIENLESLEDFITTEDATEGEETSAPAVLEDAASESTDEEKQDASPDAAN